MSYDPRNRQMVLFGGAPGPGGVGHDTWVWTGTTWIEKRPPLHPDDRTGAAMAYDSNLKRVILFGGGDDESIDYADTWTWNGERWALFDARRSPATRTHMAVAAVRGRPMIFGGVRLLAVYLDDTWVLRSG
jgi:hypothetical protein